MPVQLTLPISLCTVHKRGSQSCTLQFVLVVAQLPGMEAGEPHDSCCTGLSDQHTVCRHGAGLKAPSMTAMGSSPGNKYPAGTSPGAVRRIQGFAPSTQPQSKWYLQVGGSCWQHLLTKGRQDAAGLMHAACLSSVVVMQVCSQPCQSSASWCKNCTLFLVPARS